MMFAVSLPDAPGFPHYFLLIVCLICAVTDLRGGVIRNRVTLPAIAVGLLYNAFWAGHGAFTASLLGLALGLLPFGLAASRGWIGGGDAKLFGAIGAVAGWLFLVTVLFYTFLFAGVYGILVLVRARVWARAGTAGAESDGKKRSIRMGLFIFFGVTVSTLRIWAS